MLLVGSVGCKEFPLSDSFEKFFIFSCHNIVIAIIITFEGIAWSEIHFYGIFWCIWRDIYCYWKNF